MLFCFVLFCCMKMIHLHHQHEQNTVVYVQFSTTGITPAKCSLSGVKKTNILNPTWLMLRSCLCCKDTELYVAVKRVGLTLSGKFNYWCKWREKGNNTERRMTLYVDNLYVIDCHCSVVTLIHSVIPCYGSIWDCSVIITMMHQLNWAELNYFSLSWETNTKQDGNCKLWMCQWSK